MRKKYYCFVEKATLISSSKQASSFVANDLAIGLV
jgi:hypothetical protein